MLQFLTIKSETYSQVRQVEMAIQGGCKWIELSSAALSDNETKIREVVEEIIPLCRQANAFLIIENDIDLVENMKVHGLLMLESNPSSVSHARERLGAEAVIGVHIKSTIEALALKHLDIDYFVVTAPENCLEQEVEPYFSQFKEFFNENNILIHLVAKGNISADLASKMIKAQTVSGIEVSERIIAAEDPTKEMEKYLASLKNA